MPPSFCFYYSPTETFILAPLRCASPKASPKPSRAVNLTKQPQNTMNQQGMLLAVEAVAAPFAPQRSGQGALLSMDHDSAAHSSRQRPARIARQPAWVQNNPKLRGPVNDKDMVKGLPLGDASTADQTTPAKMSASDLLI